MANDSGCRMGGYLYCSHDCMYEDLESEIEDTGPDEDEFLYPDD